MLKNIFLPAAPKPLRWGGDSTRPRTTECGRTAFRRRIAPFGALILALVLAAPAWLQAQSGGEGALATATGQTAAPPAPAAVPPAAPPADVEPAPAPQPARPDDQPAITQELVKADTAYRQGDYIGALDALWAAQEMMWRMAPLGVRNVAFVTEQPENFGTYLPKIGENFKSSEPLILYCEPIGFTQLKEGDTYRYSMIGAFDILNINGQVLGGQRNLGPYEQSNYRTFNTETMLVMTIGIHGLPVGSYTMRITLTDNLDRTKSVQLDKPFNVVE